MAGTTKVTGTFNTGTFPTVVQSGATLAGTGTITGPVTVNSGGTMSPGLSPGILNSGKYTQDGTLLAEIVQPPTTTVAGTDYDQVNVTRTVILQSGSTLNLLFTGTPTIPVGKTMTIINNE